MSDTVPDEGTSIPLPLKACEDLWVFGYGSLMWKPGFEFAERVPATLFGAHRAFCVYSVRHRGTTEKPGVVLGLDLGGSCHGFAFRIAHENVARTYAYLTEREQMNKVYHEVMRRLTLADGRKVTALAYLVDRTNRQYAGRLPHDELLVLIRQGHGESGPCRDYVLNTLDALEQLGIDDHALSWLRSAV